jgi:DNA-binding NtrC family response regulator
VHVNVRVLAATNEPLEKRMKEGHFREDLYYRLNVIPIQLPPLRERREDIPLLVAHHLKTKVSPRTGQPIQITRRAVETLNAYSWPGNVRELENALERACTLCENDLVRVADLPPAVQASAPETARVPPGGRDETRFLMADDPADGSPYPLTPGAGAKAPSPAMSMGGMTLGPLKDFLREQELNYLNRALAHTSGNKEKAAELLNVSLATLYRKLAGDGAT